ncbi:GNAT family N-acetyltransferase [Paenibacillus sp. JX-17]|uniref:GNAT family N-acetyltransferase n=1 Tax=Paenibacillus lacisoli TaxID=3064525 RepID=A0ABT9CGK0_9BACL|nr:GNAT family N-acetyltransferase [Paenibacillus sp. JX-17]MDO7908385.1 GNAT family N-acetyltransferase [Paenibacillus sp. JX-17]
MQIRQLKSHEFDASVELSEYAFQYTLPAEKKEERRNSFKPEQTWGIFDDQDRLQAKFTLIPFQVYLHGQKVKMGGIAGVATWPENRRQGHVSSLLTYALKQMKESGQTLSFLHPFYFPFYRKYGWELYTEHKKYSIPVELLPPKAVVPGKIVRGVQQMEELDAVYQAAAAGYNGTLVRDTEWWTRSVLPDSHAAVYYSESGMPEGYLLYEIKDKEFICDELVYLNEQARQALWTFIANHDSMVRQVKLDFVPASDMLPSLVPDPRFTQELVPYFMARIVDVQGLIEQYPFAKGEGASLRIGIRDPHAEWNEGVWKLDVNVEGTAQFTAAGSAGEEAADPDVSCDIQALTIMLLGYRRPLALHRTGRLSGSLEAVHRLERWIPQAETFLMDFF